VLTGRRSGHCDARTDVLCPRSEPLACEGVRTGRHRSHGQPRRPEWRQLMRPAACQVPPRRERMLRDLGQIGDHNESAIGRGAGTGRLCRRLPGPVRLPAAEDRNFPIGSSHLHRARAPRVALHPPLGLQFGELVADGARCLEPYRLSDLPHGSRVGRPTIPEELQDRLLSLAQFFERDRVRPTCRAARHHGLHSRFRPSQRGRT